MKSVEEQISMRIGRNKAGNTLALVIAVAVVVILLGIFALNYSNIFLSHRKAQTAIDSVALQIAKDMARVVVNGTAGQIALVDQPLTSASTRPIYGINSRLA